MRFLLLIPFLLFFRTGVSQEECPTSSQYDSDQFIYVKDCISVTKKKPKNYTFSQEKKQIEENITVKLSQKILTKVTSESTHKIKESNAQFNESFNETVSLSSDIDLSGIPEIIYCISGDEYCGYVEVNKLELARSIESVAISSLRVLKSNLDGKNLNDKVAISPIKENFKNIMSKHEASLMLGLQEDDEWNSLVNSVSKKIGELEKSNAQIEIENNLLESQRLISNKKFREGFEILNRVKVALNGEKRFERIWNNAVDEYKTHINSVLPLLVENNKFDEALELIQELCWEISCDDEMVELQRDIKKQCFHSTSEQFNTAIKYKIRGDVEKHWAKLETLRDVDLESYTNLYDKYINYRREDELKKAENLKHLGHYKSAYEVLTNLESNYGRSDREITSFKNEMVKKMYREEARNVKSTRPKLFSVWAGLEGFSNNLLIDSIQKFQLKYYYFGYSGGLYYKYRFEKSNWRKSYPINSDFIGLKLRMIDYRSVSNSFLTDTVSYLSAKQNNYQFDVALDGILYRIFHYSAGINVGKDVNWNKPNYYFLSGGIRLPISYFSIIADCNTQTLFKGKSNFILSLGIHGRLDYKRKFNYSDRRRIKASLF